MKKRPYTQMMQGPLGCPSSGEKVMQGPLGFPSSEEKMMHGSLVLDL